MAGSWNQLGLDLGHELIVDLFAGGGGTSVGISQALGRDVDIAVNHDAQAIAMHAANHPGTEHFCESVFKVNPQRVTRNQPVGLLHASPDCTHHSKAKGGKPVSKKIRGLAWVVVKWARRTRPRVITLENVEEFADWGPVGEDGRPCKRRKGQEFDKFVAQLERLGYVVEHRLLRACDYGAPTIRKRLFLVARRDGRSIAWPKPTHGPADDPRVKRGQLLAYRSAAECIDWSIPCPSIFERKRPLADNTMRRIAKGIQRFVLDTPRPFIVPVTHGGDDRVHDSREPLRTVTTAHGGEFMIAAPFIVKPNHAYQWFRGQGVDQPLHTVTAGGNQYALAVPFIAKHRASSTGSSSGEPLHTITAGGHQEQRPGTGNAMSLVLAFMEQANTGMVGHPATAPVSTIVGKGCTQRLVHAHLLNQKGSDQRHRDARDPAPTICAGGTHASVVAALMAPYYGSGSGETGRDLRDPAPTATSKDRLQLVTTTIDGETYVLTDIGMRMLQPRELYRAQGFPDHYIIDRGTDNKQLPKHSQVRMCGNSVCPPVIKALVESNFSHESAAHRAA